MSLGKKTALALTWQNSNPKLLIGSSALDHWSRHHQPIPVGDAKTGRSKKRKINPNT